jgi:hypothetical protein
MRSGSARSGGRWWLVAPLAIVALLVIREQFDPYLGLFLRQILWPGPEPVELVLHDGVAVQLYADTRPHIGKIAALQKGMVLVVDGEPLIEEGYGFGLPLIQMGDLVYNSRHAEVAVVDARTLVKHYSIDVADRWSRFLRVKYKDVDPLGIVTVTYTAESSTTLRIDVDFTGLEVDWRAAYLMNEQGAESFPIYEDSTGARRHGDEIGIWHPEDDPFGCWISLGTSGEDANSADAGLTQEVRFCVTTEPDRRRYVGRERYNQYNWVRIYMLSWSGIDIEIDAPVDHYSYTLQIEARE